MKSHGSVNFMYFALASVHQPSIHLALWTRLNYHGLIQEIEQRQMQLRCLPGPHQTIAERLTFLVGKLASSTVSAGKRQQLKNERDNL